jgi:hypothetical protein
VEVEVSDTEEARELSDFLSYADTREIASMA